MLNVLYESLFLGNSGPKDMYMQVQPQITSGKIPVFTLSYLESPSVDDLVSRISRLAQEFILSDELNLTGKSQLDIDILDLYLKVGKYHLEQSNIWKPEITRSRILTQFEDKNLAPDDTWNIRTPYCEVMYGIVEPNVLMEFAHGTNQMSLREQLYILGQNDDNDDIEFELQFTTQLTEEKTLPQTPYLLENHTNVSNEFYLSKTRDIISWLFLRMRNMPMNLLLPNINEMLYCTYVDKFLSEQFTFDKFLSMNLETITTNEEPTEIPFKLVKH